MSPNLVALLYLVAGVLFGLVILNAVRKTSRT